jgi:hypothetical protein
VAEVLTIIQAHTEVKVLVQPVQVAEQQVFLQAGQVPVRLTEVAVQVVEDIRAAVAEQVVLE